MTIAEKLLQIQQNLKAPKNQYNKFGEYNYRNCEDILEALKTLLIEVKAVILIHDDIVMVGERYYIKATAVLQDTESNESIANTAYAREADQRPKMDVAQLTGAASSYARKYALNGLFCIDDSKDPDTMNNDQQGQQVAAGNNRQQNRPQQQARQQGRQQSQNTPIASQRGAGKTKPVTVTNAQINALRAEIGRTGAKEAAVCYQYHIRRLQDMTVEQFQSAMLIFSQMQSKAPDPEPEQYQMTLDEMEQYDDEIPFR